MSEVAAEFRRVASAYDQPTLALISRPSSTAIVAVFRTMFSTDKPTVPTARMHDQVDILLNDLRRADLPGVPTGNGRDLCLRWRRDGWLERRVDDDGNEMYSLTSSALEGLRTVDRLTQDRSVSLSSHRIANLVRHLRDFSLSVAPDKGAYLEAQQAEKARIQAEIDRILDGGELRDASDDDIISGFTELQRLIEELPGDFSRVVESYRAFASDTISAFRGESVSSGEAVRRYLAHVRTLGTSSQAGRGFNGALQLLGDPELKDQVHRYIRTLLDDERAAALLEPEERAEIRNLMSLINDGLSQVLQQRSKVSRTLSDYISSHDAERDHELAETLRALEGEAHIWMQTAGPRAKAPVQLLEGKLEIAHLRTKMYDPANDQPPPALTQNDGPSGAGGLSLSELRARGGPSHASLRDHLRAALDGPDPVESLAQLFHDLPAELRRPVEVLGMLPLARRHGLSPTGELETYETVRPDGTLRRLDVPRYADDTDRPDTSSAQNDDAAPTKDLPHDD